jgi:uncharacterized protein YndB with AHSA1/START domain
MTTPKTTHARHDDTTVTPLSDTEVRITRTFRAPRALVWQAMTRPEHVREWYGPRATKVTSCEMDVRVGGKWRIVMRASTGDEVAFSGEYLDVQAPARIVQTWRFEPIPDAESVETMTLEERGETTRMTALVKHSSKENLQGHLQSGMEEGMRETYERLDELLGTMRA